MLFDLQSKLINSHQNNELKLQNEINKKQKM